MTSKTKKSIHLKLVLYGLLVMLFCTKSSPIYTFNDWFDANAYFTMGKGLMNGAVPYKDLFDHKGPFLYLLYGIGYLLDHTGFFGVFLLQVILLVVVLICVFKIALLYGLPNRIAFLAATFTPFVMLSEGFYTTKYNYGGGSPDEFILPIFSMILYLVIRLIKKEDLFSKVCIYMLIIGILSSLIFLLKFTYLSFVFGLLLPLFICLVTNKLMVFIKAFVFFVLGFFTGVIPYLIYSLITKSLGDFFDAYIIFNKAYGSNLGGNSFSLLATGLKNLANVFLGRNMLFCLIIAMGLIYFLFVYREQLILNLSIMLSFMMGSIILSVVPFDYNFIIFGIFFIFGFMALYDMIHKVNKVFNFRSSCNQSNDYIMKVIAICLVFFSTVANNGLVSVGYNKLTHVNIQESCQERIANIILSDQEQDYSLLEVNCLDGGFYTKLGTVPKSKYFYKPNISFNKYPKLYISQYEDIIKKLNKYVVIEFDIDLDNTEGSLDFNSLNYKKKLGQAISKNYELLTAVNGTNLQKNTKFYLYRRID